ncbi:aspartate kinase [Texcoconibacillus texcoconensis]|uniref:Aspartokinase n=1 Tax=Texcoconibacillus texcoconensis TaxID=1095777 RepID=A0A840QMT9_9BACI|nr:aspartate kinase [Texcoconibacillus texcoconensis]MBB5172676.1 aspartate kinase [Texcoconibacillus texcoconensis]
MATVVQKFGGTSVGDVEKIKRAADRVYQQKQQGKDVVTVVSAMGKTTDTLVDLAYQISDEPAQREMDMLLTTGEQVTISLMVMALQERGIEAVSLTGWQAGIRTEDRHGDARITNIETETIDGHLEEGKVVIVAGFQGMTEDREITTLGRGGSDTSAVALAAALKAESCSIYTDVTGVYTTDPRYIEKARKLDGITYDEMLELANLGAGVLHPRAVEFAKNYQIPLIVRSSQENVEGTLVEEDASMEQNLIVRGIAFESSVTKITVEDLPNEVGSVSGLFSKLAESGINVDIIVQQVNQHNKMNISFSIHSSSLEETLEILDREKSTLGFSAIQHEDDLSKVSIVGSGMISNPGVAADMFAVLAEKEIPIQMISTSEIKVSVVVSEPDMVNAVEALHTYFELDERIPITNES